MTDVALVAIIAAVPPTVTALAGLVVSLKNSKKANDAAVKQEEIHGLVNSNLTKVKNELADARSEIRALHAAKDLE